MREEERIVAAELEGNGKVLADFDFYEPILISLRGSLFFEDDVVVVGPVFARRESIDQLEVAHKVTFIENADAVHYLLNAQWRRLQHLSRLLHSELL